MSATPATFTTTTAAPTSPFRRLTPTANRNAAIALLIATLLIGFAAIAFPAWWLYDHYDSRAAQLARQQRSYSSLNELRPTLMKALEALKAKDTKKFFLKGATAALAGADLQEMARGVIEANNGRLLSSQLLPHKDENGYRQVNATIQMTANIQNLRQVLHVMEGREPYLFLDNLTVRAQVPSGFKPQPGFEPEMFVQFDVSGLVPITPVAPPTDTKPAASKTAAKSKS
ncbi:MAG: type II secretion system protein GspM [Burkholderiales bacterium]|jgi:general secretion pathway protein M|nr:type II secretion system protein GspM [Betaproteobacteria bacterium]